MPSFENEFLIGGTFVITGCPYKEVTLYCLNAICIVCVPAHHTDASVDSMEFVPVRLPLRVLADSTGWRLAAWLVAPGAKVYRNQRVAALQSTSTGAMDHALAPREGTLARIVVAEGSRVNDGGDTPLDFQAAIAEIDFCPHSVVYQGLCGVCGEEAVVSHFANVKEGTARLPVAYNARTLSVTRAEAESVASVTARQLLKERRLLLVLDLDHTLVHATDDPRAAAVLKHSPSGCDTSSVFSFSLAPPDASGVPHGPSDSRMHLKLRPHLSEFLSRCSALFELHIYTMGSRPYADRVAELIDPDKRLFSGRITSREDFEEGRSNQKNISRLFPCDDSMVLIIDDREDVWVSGTGASFMPNLIRAKPYSFFNGLHEAYDRALSSGPGPSTNVALSEEPSSVSKSVDSAMAAAKADCSGVVSSADCTVDNQAATTAVARILDDDAIPTKPVPSAGKDLSPVEKKSSANGVQVCSVADGVEMCSVADDGGACPAADDENVGFAAKDGDVEGVEDIVDGTSSLKAAVASHPSLAVSEPMPVLSDALRKLVSQWWENDMSPNGWSTHLQRLADVLELCHTRFFGKLPDHLNAGLPAVPLEIPADVKAIVAHIRSGILDGCVLTFTGVIPLTTAPEQSGIWELATRHGALCRKDFVIGETTHVIASAERGLSTEKTKAAVESGTAFVVDTAWLEDSTIQFERRPELLYNLLSTVACTSWEEHRADIGANFTFAADRRQQQLTVPGSNMQASSGVLNAVARVVSAVDTEATMTDSPHDEDNPRPRKRRKETSEATLDVNYKVNGNGREQRVVGDEEAEQALDAAFDF